VTDPLTMVRDSLTVVELALTVVEDSLTTVTGSLTMVRNSIAPENKWHQIWWTCGDHPRRPLGPAADRGP